MTPIHLTRFALAFAVVAAVGVLAMPAFAAASQPASATIRDGRSADTVDAAYAVQRQVLDGRSPDTLDAVNDMQFQTADGRSPDTLDAAYTTHTQVGNTVKTTPLDGRSPDTLDAASAPQPVTFVQPGGFDWADAGIGAGIATALLALIAGTMLLWFHRHPRQRIQAT